LALKAITDYSSRNASLSITCQNDVAFREKPILDRRRIMETLTYVKKTTQLAIPNGPWLRISDIKEALVSGTYDDKKEVIGLEEELRFALEHPISDKPQTVYKNILLESEKTCCALLAYKTYENAINTGEYKMGETVAKLLSGNRIICAGELKTEDLLQTVKKKEQIFIASTSPEHLARLSYAERSYTKQGSLLILQQLSGNIKSVNYVDN